MAKKKKGPPPPKKKKSNPIADLLQEHPEITRELAQEIVDAGLSYEEWEAQQAAAREQRRIANQERMAKLLCTQHPKLTHDQAMEIIQRNITPEAYFEEQKRKPRFQAKPKRPFSPKGKGGSGHGGPRQGGPKRGGGPKQKKFAGPSPKQIERRKKIEELLKTYPELTRAVAGQIASGNLTYEKFIESRERKHQKALSHRTNEEIESAKEVREQRKQRLLERVQQESHLGHNGDTYIQSLIENEIHVEILRFHAPSFDGVFVEVEPFLLYLRTKTQPKLKLIKRYCALFFKKEDQNKIYTQLKIAPHQFSLRQYPHREPSKRYNIPEDLLENGAPLSVLLHNGLQVTGDIIWFDRFQLLLQLPLGGEIFIFRHSIHLAQEEEIAPEGGVLSLVEFFSTKPQLPKPHPEELPITEIEVPVNFNDFPVKDTVYEQYEEAFEQGNFQLKPITVRREGDSYVLIDGYRRLTLAKERGIEILPVVVI